MEAGGGLGRVERKSSAHRGSPSPLQELEIVPPSESLNFKSDLKNTGPKRAAKIYPPNHNAGR